MEDQIQCNTAFIISPRISIVLPTPRGSTPSLTSDIIKVENQHVLLVKHDKYPNRMIELLTDHGVEQVIMLVTGRSLDEEPSHTWMPVRDHINWTGKNPLRGPNTHRGPRFPDMSSPYQLRQEEKGIVCAGVNDLSFISPAEKRMMAVMGTDWMTDELVSTNIILNHSGISCFAFVTEAEISLKVEELPNFIP